jgi:ATP-binding cassette subfamily B protein
MDDTKITRSAFVNFIYTLVIPYKNHLLGLGLAEIAWAFDLSIRPYLIKVILDRLEQNTADTDLSSFIIVPASLFIFFSIIRIFIFRGSDYIYSQMMPFLRKDIILGCLNQAQQQSYSYFQKHFGGTIATKISETADAIEYLIHLLIYKFFAHFLAFIIACITIGYAVHPVFSIILFISALLFIPLNAYLSRIPYNFAQQHMEAYTALVGKLVDSIANMLSVFLFAHRKFEFSYIEKQAMKEAYLSQHLQLSIIFRQTVTSFLLIILTSVCLFYLVYLRQQGLVTIGDFALVLTIVIAIADNLQDMGRDFLKFAEILGKCSQTLTLMSEPLQMRDVTNAQQLKVTRGEIDFQKVCFRYKSSALLFDNLTLKILPHQKIGLVGYSGSGKTTFLNLLLRIFDLYSGRILIDGQDISCITQDSLHEAISFVPQEPILFNRTILENISYGKPGARFEEVVDAAKKAFAHEFIQELPDQYETVVGERGMGLSGGQRQRIAIARGILKNSQILILDEITSSLDPISEHYLQKSIREVMRDKTVLIIAHHLDTLLGMDRILVFEKGKVTGDGSHQELIQTNALYQKLWQIQEESTGKKFKWHKDQNHSFSRKRSRVT